VVNYLEGKSERGEEFMIDPTLIELGLLISSGAIGSLLVWGYQNWFK
jgi:hypothetical protein